MNRLTLWFCLSQTMGCVGARGCKHQHTHTHTFLSLPLLSRARLWQILIFVTSGLVCYLWARPVIPINIPVQCWCIMRSEDWALYQRLSSLCKLQTHTQTLLSFIGDRLVKSLQECAGWIWGCRDLVLAAGRNKPYGTEWKKLLIEDRLVHFSSAKRGWSKILMLTSLLLSVIESDACTNTIFFTISLHYCL